jgi:hypothetical protein
MAGDGQDADDDAREAARQRRIADACLESAPADGRLGLYRNLVQGNLAAVVRRLVPRTAATLDRAEGGGFGAWLARFLAEAGPRTPYLRDVPGELVAWARPLWRATTLPPFVGDLARHEIDLFELDAAPAIPPPALGEVALDRRLVFATPRTLARYDHAVHELVADVPAAVTFILMHRDDDNTVHSTVLDPAIAGLIGRTLDGLTLGEALAAADTGATDPLDVARWLADLGAKGALLGGEG